MLICPHCNYVVSEENACVTDTTHELQGGYNVVVSSFSHYGCCPECGYELEQATKCKVCGDYYYDETAFPTPEYGVCEECLEQSLSIKRALSLGKTNPEKIDVNGFALFLLGEDKINDILCDYIKNMKLADKSEEVSDFLSQDKAYLADFLETEGE